MTTAAPAKVDESKTATETTTTTTTEAPAAEAPKTAEQEAAEDAEFGAGFNSTHGEESPHAESRPAKEAPKVEAPKAEATTDKPAPAAPAKTDAPVVEDKVVFAGLTESQLKSAIAKAGEVDDLKKQITAVHDKAFGRLGELQAALKALPQPTSGQPVKVTAEMLKRLKADGFEELATALAEDLSGLVLGGGSASSFDKAAYDKDVDEKVAAATDKLQRSTEKKLLTIAHPDWEACWAAEDFRIWRATLPAEGQQVLNHSWDSQQLSGALTDFKEWRAQAQKAKAEADAKAKTEADAAAAAATKSKDKRLEQAITPKTGGAASSASTDDDAAFEEGFKKAQTGSG